MSHIINSIWRKFVYRLNSRYQCKNCIGISLNILYNIYPIWWRFGKSCVCVCVYVLGNVFVSSFRFISWFRCMFFALVHFIIFFFGLYFGFCLHRNFHPSSETKREQNSLFAIQPPPPVFFLANLNIMSLPYLLAAVVVVDLLSISWTFRVFWGVHIPCEFLSLSFSVCVCVPRIVQQSRVFLRFEQHHPPHAIKRHRATATTTTIHVHILWKLKLVFYRFVAVRLPAIFPLLSSIHCRLIVSLYFVFYFLSSFHAL